MIDMQLKIFDSHLHHFNTQYTLQESADIFRRAMEVTHAEKFIFHALPKNRITDNLAALYFKAVFPGQAYAFAGLERHKKLSDEESAKDFVRQMDAFLAAGFDGLKMLEGKPTERRRLKKLLSDPVYDPLYSYLEERGVSVTLHSGDPDYFWSLESMKELFDEIQISKDETFEDVMAVMKKHPKLRVTLAHYGFTGKRLDQAKRFLDDYEYTAFDTTPACSQYFAFQENADAWSHFLQDHARKIKYGTDIMNYDAPLEQILIDPMLVRNFYETKDDYLYQGNNAFKGKTCRGIGIDKNLLPLIYYENAAREYGDPKPLDPAFIAREIAEKRKLCTDQPEWARDLSEIEAFFHLK